MKAKTWIKAKSTQSRWKRAKGNTYKVVGFTIENPLICPDAAGGDDSGSGSDTSDQLKDLVNLGPETFQGTAVWHIRATNVSVDPQGQTSEATYDFLIGQKPFLPYVFSVTASDPENSVTLVEKQILTQFGKKVQVKAPKVGSKTP